MKIRYCSDIHLEFNAIPHKNKFKVDPDEVLLIAGDTIPALLLKERMNDASSRSTKKKFRKFLDLVSGFKQVYMIMGNHEHYCGGVFTETYHILSDFIKKTGHKNIKVLDKSYEYLGNNVYLLACSLWVDFNKNDPNAHNYVQSYMNDFMGSIAMIDVEKNNDKEWLNLRRFTTQDAYNEHQKDLGFIQRMYSNFVESVEDPEIIVMTHHGPSFVSAKGNPRSDVNGGDYGYYSDLSEFILERPNIKYWIHGHSHYNVNYKIGETQILGNMRGYGIEFNKDIHFDTFSLDPFIEI